MLRYSASRLRFVALAAAVCAAPAFAGDKLEGRAVLPAATFSPGPTSGRFIGASGPFIDQQPVQGFSAIVDNHDGTYWAMSDNGFGNFSNSADYELRVYLIRPNFETKDGGPGTIDVLNFIQLHDPDKKIGWAITNFFTGQRILTGADFDIESMQRASDGTLWFGDEFGPFLLHTDAAGKLLDPPIALPDFDNPGQEVRAAQNPKHEEASAIRIMNAMRVHGEQSGNFQLPVFSPWDPMLDDGNPNTFIDNRQAPPAGSGLDPASSELFNVGAIQSAGYPVVVYTINDSARMEELLDLGVKGIISDRPDLLYAAVAAHGGLLLPNGLIDASKFDAQGHRGARNLRPENTLPAFEVALDNLMTTLETDLGISLDGVPMLDHDPAVEALTCRRTDGTPYDVPANEVFVKDLTAAQIQADFICDKVFRGPEQVNNPALSPASVAFAASIGLPHVYAMPTLQNLLDFVNFYIEYYGPGGAGEGHPQALLRRTNAQQVRFNVETKVNPRTDLDPIKGVPFASRTIEPEPFVAAALAVIQNPVNDAFDGRIDIQSFDFRTLLLVHEHAPEIRIVCLFGDFPKFDDNGPGTDDSTNLQPGEGLQSGNTPWLAGLPWPYRVTKLDNPFRAATSGGFEGMALTPSGAQLLPLLERPLTGDPQNALLIHEFDLASKTYNGNRHIYPLDPRGTNIGDFILYAPGEGLIIERDGTQGDLNGFKVIFQVTFGNPGTAAQKNLAVDLLRINDRHSISLPAAAGDVGLGKDFAFPFVTIEDVLFFDSKTIGVLNDNNYPFSIGRHVGSSQPDDNEFVIIKLDQPLQ